MTIRYQLLEGPVVVAPFAGMTYPHYRPELLASEPNGPTVAIGAFDDEVACGLALARIEGHMGEVVSVFVKAEHRGHGIGTALLAALEPALRARGVRELSGTFPSGREATPAVERVLAKAGWETPEPKMYLFTGGPETSRELLSAPWMRNPLTLPPEYQFFPWAELTEAERASIVERMQDENFPLYVSPFQDAWMIHLPTSIGLRYGGQVAGWVITHLVGDRTIRYTALYVDPKLPLKGVGMRMLTEVLTRHVQAVEAGTVWGGSCGIHAQNPFAHVFQGRVLRYLPGVTTTLTMATRKELSPGGAAPA